MLHGIMNKHLVKIERNKQNEYKIFDTFEDRIVCICDDFSEVIKCCNRISNKRKGLYNFGDILEFQYTKNYTICVKIIDENMFEIIEEEFKDYKLVRILREYDYKDISIGGCV